MFSVFSDKSFKKAPKSSRLIRSLCTKSFDMVLKRVSPRVTEILFTMLISGSPCDSDW